MRSYPEMGRCDHISPVGMKEQQLLHEITGIQSNLLISKVMYTERFCQSVSARKGDDFGVRRHI